MLNTKHCSSRFVLTLGLIGIGFILNTEKPGYAFDSVGLTIHQNITRDALKGLMQDKNPEFGFSKSDLETIITANFHQDFDEVHILSVSNFLVPNEKYNPSHHFDRNFNMTDTEAFDGGRRYLKSLWDAILDDFIKRNDRKAALVNFGRYCHALQDFFSHSNCVSLSSTEILDCYVAVLNPELPRPKHLILTGYDRRTGKDILGDPYGHSIHCKDNLAKNDDAKANWINTHKELTGTNGISAKTNYEAAVAFATQITKNRAEEFQQIDTANKISHGPKVPMVR